MCTPARATLMTGLDPVTSGAWANCAPLTADARTIGQYLEEVGYHTAYVGKWHLDGSDYYGDGVCPAGWDPDYWYEGRRYVDELGGDAFRLWRSGLRSIEDLRKHEITAEFTMAHRVTERAFRFLEQQPSDSPFLLVVSYDEPHEPFTCPPEYAEPFEDQWFPLGRAAHDTLADKPMHHGDWAADGNDPDGVARVFWDEDYGAHVRGDRFCHPLYFGCNSFVDAEIGRLIEAVHERHGDRTVVIHTSDHGTMKGAHRLVNKGPAMYEELVRVPLIMTGPAEFVPPGTVTEPVSHYDVAPTILDLAGVPVPDSMTGRILIGRQDGMDDSAAGGAGAIFIQYNQWNHNAARPPAAPYRGRFPIRTVIHDGWKLVVNLNGEDELYHLDADPAETNLLCGQSHPEAASVAEPLLELILGRMTATGDRFHGLGWGNRPWL